MNFDKELAIHMVLNTLPSCHDQFFLTYHLNNTKTKLMQLHNWLQTAEVGMKKSHPTIIANAPVLAIHQGKGKKRKFITQPRWMWQSHIGESSRGLKGKANYDVPHVSDLKDSICFHCGKRGFEREATLNTYKS